MSITLDIKTLIAVGSIIAVLGGFYYSTQHRLNSVESKIETLSEKIDSQTGQIKQIQKQIRKYNN